MGGREDARARPATAPATSHARPKRGTAAPPRRKRGRAAILGDRTSARKAGRSAGTVSPARRPTHRAGRGSIPRPAGPTPVRGARSPPPPPSRTSRTAPPLTRAGRPARRPGRRAACHFVIVVLFCEHDGKQNVSAPQLPHFLRSICTKIYIRGF